MVVATERLKASEDRLSVHYVELSFGVIGKMLPADHGYGQYSALSHICPSIHGNESISIQTISGEPDRQGKIALSKGSRLRIRLPYRAELIAQILPLAGQHLKIGIHEIQLGIPQIFPLQPHDKLRSRIVTIKKFQEPESFQAAAQRQLDALGIQGNLFIPLDTQGEPLRKAIKIKTFSVVGFSVVVTDLSDEDSLKLQQHGLGGKHRMGCGIFTSFPHAWRLSDG